MAGENETESYENYKQWRQKSLDSPMPLIGMYVAAASLVCSIAMAGDVIHGIRRKKLWFPCKYFSVNAASLTLIAVATKLSVDLNTGMWGAIDVLAKFGNSAFMITMMGNFLISFASMNNKEIFANIVALGILVITITVNIGIQQYARFDQKKKQNASARCLICHTVFVVFMLVLFVTMSSSVLMILTAKRHMELKYNELHKKIACEGGKLEETGNLTHDKLKEVVKKHWLMAESGSPQFVMARSVTSAMSGAICLLTTIYFVPVAIVLIVRQSSLNDFDSTYRWSTVVIFMIQSIGMVVGTIAPICRWFTTISFNYNYNSIFTKHHHEEFKLVETFWIERLVALKDTPLPSQIRGMKCKRVVRYLKILVLNLCIGVQIGIVVTSKLVHFISTIIALLLFSCFYCWKRKEVDLESESSALGAKDSISELDPYVLRLEGEGKLPKSILKNMLCELKQLIQMGKSRQPQNLLEFLRNSNKNFKGVVDFDSNQVQYCWTLPVVTLTSIAIAIALPGIDNHKVDQLMSSVSEGLLYINLVQESFSHRGDHLLNLKCAANVVWAGIELNCKWLDKDLRKQPLEERTMEGTLETIVSIAEKATIEFQRSVIGGPKVLAANSMKRISQTILNDYRRNTYPHADGNLFEKLSIMIADILGACLTNLPRVIIRKCYRSTIEEREKSVRHAARLLGETEEILAILRHRELPSLSGEGAAYIDEWRSSMMQKDPSALFPSSTNEVPTSGPIELHVNVAE